MKLPNKIGVFTATVSGSGLSKVLAKVDRVIKYSDADKLVDDTQMLVAAEGKLYVIGATVDTMCCHEIGEAEGEGALIVDFSTIKRAADGKKELKIAFDKKQLSLKSGKFNSTLVTKPANLQDIETLESDINNHRQVAENSKYSIDHSDLSNLVKASSLIWIKDAYIAQARPAICVTSNDGTMTAVTRTHWSVSKTSFESKSGNFRFPIYTELVQVIHSLSGDGDVNVHTDINGSIVVSNDIFLAAFPPASVTEEDYQAFDLMEDISGEAAVKMKMEGNQLRSIITSAETLFPKNDSAKIGTVKVKDGKARVSYECDLGSVSDIIECKNKGNAEFRIDLLVFAHVFKAAKKLGDAVLSVFGLPGKYKSLCLTANCDGFKVSYRVYIPS